MQTKMSDFYRHKLVYLIGLFKHLSEITDITLAFELFIVDL